MMLDTFTLQHPLLFILTTCHQCLWQKHNHFVNFLKLIRAALWKTESCAVQERLSEVETSTWPRAGLHQNISFQRFIFVSVFPRLFTTSNYVMSVTWRDTRTMFHSSPHMSSTDRRPEIVVSRAADTPTCSTRKEWDEDFFTSRINLN